MTHSFRVCLICLVSLILTTASAADLPHPATAAARGSDVLKHLENAISWYHSVNAVERSGALAGDIVLRDTARRTSVQALQLAFDFARAQTALSAVNEAAAAPNNDDAQPGAPNRNMDRVAAKAAERVAKLEVRLKDLDRALATASPASRAVLTARRKQAVAQLNFAKEIQGSVQTLVSFMGNAASTADGLASRIDQLERSVPEVVRTRRGQAAASGSTPSADAQAFHPESAGVLGLVTELLNLTRTRSQLKHVIEDSDALAADIGRIRTPLGNELRGSVRRIDAIGAAPQQDDAQSLGAGQREIELLTARFKALSAAVVPLREEGILVESTRGTLREWRAAVDARYSSVSGYLVMRAIVLGAAIGLILLISELWRRMTFRYARDARRRRQFLVVRRIVVGCAVGIVVVLGFISEVGSLATYAGFLTAGLAVALQNPILSVVAYFFLIGRYGVRVGDRVTISGVTGDIVEIGLVRVHLMELSSEGSNLVPTGRVVSFSNSVLFQPAALFKRIPGADYVWRKAAVMLAPACDSRIAQERLMRAVDSVYGEYKENIEKQHAAFERSVDVKLSAPQPSGSVRVTDSGLEFTVHYPVEPAQASTVDERIARALHKAVEDEPELAAARSMQAKATA